LAGCAAAVSIFGISFIGPSPRCGSEINWAGF
jgi:hypothetical protein